MQPAKPAIESILAAAVEMQSEAERRKFLDTACAGDADLRRRVEQLTENHFRAGDFLESPAAALPLADTIDPYRTIDEPPGTETPGMMIGPYKLLRQIGEGGMGTVFMAEQTHPVQRMVALKIIKPGMDSRQVIARFEAERQALALMDHPNIAKVLDAGTIGPLLAPVLGGEGSGVRGYGRPYFVMELVKGVPMTKYCDEHRLSPRQRLELFMPICQAIQHAHQKGVIHRDLKPSNVLVAEHDDKPVPKVIDFGVAKATGHKLTEHTMFTEFGQVVGTLEYMSPEQAKLNALDIDTRTDIYALGVLLYELLTGTTRFEKKRLRQSALDEILRIIREEEPPKPSTRLSTAEQLPAIAANRGLEPKKLSGLVRGELDWIVMKCLEKDRNRRYETANGLAHDIERYLHDEPVAAGPPSTAYRFRKFARRHKVAFTMASLVSALLVLSVLILAFSNVRIQQEREQKDAAYKQAQENPRLALKALDEIYLQVAEERLPRDPQRKKEDQELLKKALGFYQQFAEGNSTQSPVRLEVSRAHRRAGDIQRFVGDHAAAQQAYRLAIVPGQALVSEFPGQPEYCYDLAITHNALAEELLGSGEGASAAEQFRKAIELLTKLTTDYPTAPQYRAELARSHEGLGKVHNQQGERKAANASFEQALEIQSKLCAEFPSVPQYRADLAEMHRYRGGWIEFGWPSFAAEDMAHIRRAFEVLRKLVADFPAIPSYRARLARTLTHLGNSPGLFKERIDYCHQAIDIMTKLTTEFPEVPEYHQELSTCYSYFGLLYQLMGDMAEHAKYMRKSLDLQAELASRYPSVTNYRENLAAALANMADALVFQGKLAEARKLLKDAITEVEALSKSYPDNPRYPSQIVPLMYQLASIDATLGDTTQEIKLRHEADTLFGETWRQLRTGQGPSSAARFSADVAATLQALADLLKNTGNHKEMAKVYRAALKAFDQAIALDSNNADAHFRRGQINAQLSRHEEAVADFSRVIELNPESPGAWYNNPRGVFPLLCRAAAYVDMRHFDKAIADYSKAIELDPQNEGIWNNRAGAYRRLGQMDKAIADYSKAIELKPDSSGAFDSRGFAYAAFKHWDKAIADYSKAIELDPKNGWPLGNRAYAYGELNQWDKAIADYSKAIELDPKNGWRFSKRADIYSQLKQWDKAMADYSKAIELDPKDGWALGTRANIYSQLKQWDKAITDYSKAIELDPKNGWSLGDRATAYGELKQWDKAIADYSKAIELDPKNASWWNSRAATYSGLKHWDKAIADYSKVIELNPKDAWARYNRAHSHAVLGEWDKAAADSDKAVELNPDNGAWWWQERGSYHLQAGDTAGYRLACKQMLERFGDTKDPIIAHRVALSCVLLPKAVDDEKLVLQLAEQSVKGAPDDQWCPITLGAAQYRAGQFEAVADLGLMVKSWWPENPYATPGVDGGPLLTWLILATAHHRLGHIEEARRWLDKAVQRMDKESAAKEVGPLRQQSHVWAMCLLWRREAEELLLKPGGGQPGHVEAVSRYNPYLAYSMGRALARRGSNPEAIAEFTKTVQSKPDYRDAWLERGLTYSRMKELDRAIADCNKVIGLDPNHALGHFNLANALYGKRDLAGAIRAYQAALKIDPNYAEAHCNLGLVFKNQGRFAEALAALQRGNKLGSQRTGWPYPSTAWVRDVEQLAELDGKLAKVLKGEGRPANASERLQFAFFCQTYKQLYTTAAGWYLEAFAAEPKAADDLKAFHRYNAACAAALAGCGKGHDADKMTDDERARLRRQAEDWLRADLAVYAKHLQGDNQQDRTMAQQQLKHWQRDDDLVGIRDSRALAKLPASERAAWVQFWTEVETTLRKTPEGINK
jgi:tetratricopeptide (TPR) repeat protein